MTKNGILLGFFSGLEVIVAMKKCIIVPDSFKGTLSSQKICSIISQKVQRYFPGCICKGIPVADGGEGTVECFYEALGGTLRTAKASSPYFEEMEAEYLIHDRTAIIEMAKVAGLPMVERENRKNPAKTTTYGVGMLMLDAVKQGCEHIIIGLGGSCTNDAGCGMAAALGTRFLDREGREFVPTGDTLEQVASIDIADTQALLEGVKITAMCDIDNPMTGPKGAAYVFGPQKGADPEMVQRLDENLTALAQRIHQDLGVDVQNLPGAGAAGALGAGLVAFCGGTLQPGIETVLQTVGFDEQLKDTDLVFTGEGRIDAQSLGGKVVIGVAEHAKQQNCPVIAIVGDVGEGVEPAYDRGVSAIFSINRVAVPFSEAKLRSERDLSDTVEDILRLIQLCQSSR